jgi:hypothetical protein
MIGVLARWQQQERIVAALPPPASPTRPTRGVRRTLYFIGIAVWVSGVLYWTFDKYMLQRSDIGLSENPLQVWWLRLHAGTATVAVWWFGYMSAVHVQRNWKAGRRRNSGSIFVGTLALLTLTGYLIYYVEADRPLAMITQLHWVVGLCAPLAFLLHRGLRQRAGLPAGALAPSAVAAPRVELGVIGPQAVPVSAVAPPPPPAPGLID